MATRPTSPVPSGRRPAGRRADATTASSTSRSGAPRCATPSTAPCATRWSRPSGWPAPTLDHPHPPPRRRPVVLPRVVTSTSSVRSRIPATAHLVRVQQSAGRAIAAVADRVTAHLHGACIGSGIELPAFATEVVAEPSSTVIALPGGLVGLVPGAGGTVSLPRRIGRHRTAPARPDRSEDRRRPPPSNGVSSTASSRPDDAGQLVGTGSSSRARTSSASATSTDSSSSCAGVDPLPHGHPQDRQPRRGEQPRRQLGVGRGAACRCGDGGREGVPHEPPGARGREPSARASPG